MIAGAPMTAQPLSRPGQGLGAAQRTSSHRCPPERPGGTALQRPDLVALPYRYR